MQDARSSNGTMVYLQGPLALPNNEQIRLRMGRSTLSMTAKRSIAASVRGTLHRLPTSIPCTASLSRLQEIMALAPITIPKSARQDPSGEEKVRSADVESSSPAAVAVDDSDTNGGAGDVSSYGILTSAGNPSSLVNEIDHALILGLDGSGGAGRDVRTSLSSMFDSLFS